MVNTGRPSEACFQCRTRKVKCDATKPACHRCTKYGVSCSGYPQKGALAFRDETRKAEARAKRIYDNLMRSKAEDDSRDSTTTNDTNPATSSAVAPRQRPSSPSSVPPPNLLSLSFFKSTLIVGSVSAFVSQWSEDSTSDMLIANFTLGGKLYPSCVDCLKAAIETMALWNLSIVSQGSDVQMNQSVLNMYGQSLKEVRLALQDPRRENMDQILLAIEYLGIFEALAEPQGNLARTRQHLIGLLALIKARGSEQFASEIGRRIFLDAYWLYVCGSIVLPRAYAVPLPDDSVEVLLESAYTGRTPEYTMLPKLRETLGLRIAVFDALHCKNGPVRAEVTRLLTVARKLEADWQEWFDSHPLLRPEFTSERSRMAAPLNLYRAMRIIICDDIVRLYYALEKVDCEIGHYEPETTEIVATAHDLVSQICESLPYTFDAFSSTRDPPGTIMTNSRKAVQHMGYSFPLLVCSMVQSLDVEKQKGVAYARKMQAGFYGLNRPFRVFPKTLVPDREGAGF